MRTSIIIAIMFLVVVPAFAKPPSDDAATKENLSREALKKGEMSFVAGDYRAALESFEKGKGLYPSPLFDYNIGRAHELLTLENQRDNGLAMEHLEKAVEGYHLYLSNTTPDPDDAPQVREKISRLRGRLDALRNPPVTTAVVPAPPAVSPPTPIFPAAKKAPLIPLIAAAPPDLLPAKSPLYKRWWLWTAVVAGVAVVAASVGIGIAASNNKQQNVVPTWGSF